MDNTWTGTISNDFANPDNWDQNHVPTIGETAVITPAGIAMPTTCSVPTTCGDIYVTDGNGENYFWSNLTIDGNFTYSSIYDITIKDIDGGFGEGGYAGIVTIVSLTGTTQAPLAALFVIQGGSGTCVFNGVFNPLTTISATFTGTLSTAAEEGTNLNGSVLHEDVTLDGIFINYTQSGGDAGAAGIAASAFL